MCIQRERTKRKRSKMLIEFNVTLLACSFLYTVQYILIFPISLLIVFYHLILERQGPSWYIFTFIKKTKSVNTRMGIRRIELASFPATKLLYDHVNESFEVSVFLNCKMRMCSFYTFHRVIGRIKWDNLNLIFMFNNQKTLYACTQKKWKLWPKRYQMINSTQHSKKPRKASQFIFSTQRSI